MATEALVAIQSPTGHCIRLLALLQAKFASGLICDLFFEEGADHWSSILVFVAGWPSPPRHLVLRHLRDSVAS